MKTTVHDHSLELLHSTTIRISATTVTFTKMGNGPHEAFVVHVELYS
jgi:hypothetical protein